MKLRNKKTGEIGYFCFANWNDPILIILDKNGVQLAKYNSLAELNEEWEDYEEPEEEFWYIDSDCETYGISRAFNQNDSDDVLFNKSIGNYFETKEEAEEAVERLRAWKRLKDKKFKFTEWYKPDGCEPFIVVETNIGYDDDNMELQKDLDLLFGGEE